jgi:ATP-dependent Clp protease adaptor protein ClpS
MEDTKTNIDLKSILNIDPPKDFKVIYIDDSVTSFEFVSDSLMKIFDYDEEPAKTKTSEISDQGSGVVALMPFEIAEQKGVEVLMAARNHGFPLQVRIEQED